MTDRRHEGSRYQETKDLDIVEVAKLVRADIKAAQKLLVLPQANVSVRVERFAGGKALRIAFTPIPTARDWPTWQVRESVRQITDQYNYSESDMMSDFHATKFYTTVTVL